MSDYMGLPGCKEAQLGYMHRPHGEKDRDFERETDRQTDR